MVDCFVVCIGYTTSMEQETSCSRGSSLLLEIPPHFVWCDLIVANGNSSE